VAFRRAIGEPFWSERLQAAGSLQCLRCNACVNGVDSGRCCLIAAHWLRMACPGCVGIHWPVRFALVGESL